MQKNMISKVLLSVVVALFVSHNLIADVRQGTQVAAVDAQKVIMQSDEWRDMMASAQKEFEEKAKTLQAQEEDLKVREKAAKDRSSINELEKDRASLTIEKRTFEADLQDVQRKSQMVIGKKVEKAIATVAEEDHWDMVEPKTFYVCERCDITQKVIDQMNKEYKAEKKASKFKKAA